MEVILPEMSMDKISNDLRYLTEILSKNGYEKSEGLLGGEYGYGAYFENETFMMHPYCWCELDDCPWCCPCVCPEEAYVYQVNEVAVEFENWINADLSERNTIVLPDLQCDRCREGREAAPNFLHKKSGSTIFWYKYIGRSMKTNIKGNWVDIFNDCLESIVTR